MPAQADWSMKHGPAPAAINGAGATAVVGLAVYAFGLPGFLPLLVGLAGVAAVFMRRKSFPRYRIACWMLPALAATWLAVRGPGLWTAIIIVVGAVVLAVLAPAAPKPGQQVEPTRLMSSEASRWAGYVNKVLNIQGVEVNKVEWWPGRIGYTVYGKLPAGHHWRRLRDSTDDLASFAENLEGCPVQVDGGVRQNEFVLKVTREIPTAEPIPHPTDYSPRSINNNFAVGLELDRTPVDINIRQDSVIVCGRRGSGKSNAEDVITADVILAEDAVAWIIDMNSADLAAGWMMPSLVEGLPFAVDWVAFDENEALLMTEVAVKMMAARKREAKQEKYEKNVKLTPISPTRPLPVIIVDETADLFGDGVATPVKRQVGENLKTLQRMGRDCGPNVIWSALRPTGGCIPVDVRTQANTRFAMRMEDNEYHYFYDKAKGVYGTSLPNKGDSYLQTDERPVPRILRWFYLEPHQQRDIVRAVADRPVVLDQPMLDVGGDIYAQRWERARPWLDSLVDGQDFEPAKAPESQPSWSGTGLDAGFAAPLASLKALVDPVEAKAAEEKRINDSFADIVAGFEETAEEPPPTEEESKTGRQQVLELLRRRGDAVKPKDIYEGLGYSRGRVQQWLKDLKAEGLVEQPEYGLWRAT